MKIRNNNKPHRQTEANQRRTQAVMDRYYGKVALLNTWESMSEQVQADNHDYIIEQRARLRTLKQMILHRADPNASI